MTGSVNLTALFREMLSLVGHEVEVSSSKSTKPFRGTVTNAMFDSLLVENNQGKHVIRFSDILSLTAI